MLPSVAVAFEYESTCLRAEHLAAAKASEADVRAMIDAFIDVIEPVGVHYQSPPQRLDPDDDMVLEAAVDGRADAIVTFNRKDHRAIPDRFGIEVLSPAEALRRIRK